MILRDATIGCFLEKSREDPDLLRPHEELLTVHIVFLGASSVSSHFPWKWSCDRRLSAVGFPQEESLRQDSGASSVFTLRSQEAPVGQRKRVKEGSEVHRGIAVDVLTVAARLHHWAQETSAERIAAVPVRGLGAGDSASTPTAACEGGSQGIRGPPPRVHSDQTVTQVPAWDTSTERTGMAKGQPHLGKSQCSRVPRRGP